MIAGGRVLSVLLSALLGGFALGQAAPNFQYFSRACAAGGKCFALIERRPQLQSPDTYIPPDADPSASPTLELRGVDFAYPTRPDVMVACNLNIVVPEGHTVALVGESGSGKSTAVSLTQRFYDPTRGQVGMNPAATDRLRPLFLFNMCYVSFLEPVQGENSNDVYVMTGH